MYIIIILLAMVAAFLGLRLYSVLGRREGHEQEQVTRRALEDIQSAVHPSGADMDAQSQQLQMPAPAAPAAESGLRSIINADRSFDHVQFLIGAKSAYAAILEAFWKGDRETLRALCDSDVYDSFDQAITDRDIRGEILDNRLVRIEEARVIDAHFDHPMARITVRFDADIASVVKNSAGEIIGGSLTDAVETHDVWTFMRDVKSDSRNWKLDETDEA